MIFATCGSSHLPFTRMMEALGSLPVPDLHVQHGPADPPPAAQADAFLSFAEVVERIEGAEVVVSHAGVGSIICSLRAGHTPIVFPRLKRYSETVDDHQAELARALADRGVVIVAWSAEELAEAVASVPARRTAAVLNGREGLSAAVRAAINGERPVAVQERRPHAGAFAVR